MPANDIIIEKGSPLLNAVVMVGSSEDPFSVDEGFEKLAKSVSEQEIADLYASVHNRFWYIEDDLYDFEPDSEEYNRLEAVVNSWDELLKGCERRILEILSGESSPAPQTASLVVLLPFVARNGYRDGAGWWVRSN